MPRLLDEVARRIDGVRRQIDALQIGAREDHFGRVVAVGDGVASVEGLAAARLDERLRFEDGSAGMAVTLDADRVGCVLLGGEAGVQTGTRVHGTGEVVQVPVGEALLGRVIDPLGQPLDGLAPPEVRTRVPAEQPAPAIVDRDLVEDPLYTGLAVIDAMIPLGRGQRQLIIGDRQTGKTSVAVDTMIRQRHEDVICVYCAIGEKTSTSAQVIEAIRAHGAPQRCLFVIAAADAPPGLQWLAPFAACAMAEWFRDRGQHALLVLDDLTRHADVHRQISLLLRQPPGREAYPGDVFYLHARLLERATRLSPERGGGSLTALPIAETRGGNLTAYIPTNLVSITDGQIYLEPRLFNEGQRPAVDVGRSVSRVGGHAQAPLLAALSGNLRLQYTQFLELEAFTRYGAMLDEHTRRQLEHGRRIRAVLVQRRFVPMRVEEEVALLVALEEGLLDDIPSALLPTRIEEIRSAAREQLAAMVQRVVDAALSATDRSALREALREALPPPRTGG